MPKKNISKDTFGGAVKPSSASFITNADGIIKPGTFQQEIKPKAHLFALLEEDPNNPDGKPIVRYFIIVCSIIGLFIGVLPMLVPVA